MPPDDRTLGELGRAIDRLAVVVDKLDEKLDHLVEQYVPRETWDIAQGSNRVDIGRLDVALQELDRRIAKEKADRAEDVKALKELSDARFRSAVRLTVTAIIAPIVVGIVVALLTAGFRP